MFFSLQKQFRSLAIIGTALFALLLLRLHLTWGNTPEFSTADNPTARASSIFTRFLTFSYLPTFNFKLLLCPVTLSFDWSMDAVPRITSFFDTRNCISLFFYLMLYQAIKSAGNNLWYKQFERKPKKKCRKKLDKICKKFDCSCPVCHHSLSEHSLPCRTNNNNNSLSCLSTCICQPKKETKRNQYATLLIALSFLTLPFLPATNLFFYVGFVVAERVLYLPSVGYCLLFGLGIGRLRKTRCYWRMACVGVLVLLLIFSLRTVRRNRDWLNEESLYRSAIPVNPPKGELLSADISLTSFFCKKKILIVLIIEGLRAR